MHSLNCVPHVFKKVFTNRYMFCFFYMSGVVEVYRVTKRVELGIKATAVCSEKLQELLKDISRVWNNLMGFMSLANLTVS